MTHEAFLEDYNKLLIYAERNISYNRIDNLLPADAVNEAYIHFVENDNYTISKAENFIIKLVKSECARLRMPYRDDIKNTDEGYSSEDGAPKRRFVPYTDLETCAICCTCKETKPIGLFPYVYSEIKERKSVRNTCLECVSKQVLKWYKNNPEKKNAYNKEYLKRTGKSKEYYHKYKEKDPERTRALARERQRRFQQKKREQKNKPIN